MINGLGKIGLKIKINFNNKNVIYMEPTTESIHIF